MPKKQSIDNNKQSADSSYQEIKQLKERVKELNCLYGLTKIVRDRTLSFDKVLKKTIDLIPSSWQHSSITCARIRLEDQTFQTNNFKETIWKQQSPIIVDDVTIGYLEVFYLKKKPEQDEGPFLKEERSLLDAIAELLGKYIDEYRIKQELEEQKRKLSHVEQFIKKEESIEEKEKKQEWEVIIDLLIKTDPRLLLRITRKMVYYLYRFENEKINALLMNICPVDRNSSTQQWCGINMPNPRQDIDSLRVIQQQVFEIARESLSPDELSNLFGDWVKQDKIRPLLLTSQKPAIPLLEITNELTRFYDKTAEETSLAPEDQMSIKTALIRRFFTNRLEYINIAKNFIEVKDFIPILQHIVGPEQGSGKLGGKTSGVILAEKIIQKDMKQDDLLQDIKFPRSWYIASDTNAEFIKYNDLDEVFHHKYLDPVEIRQEQAFLEQIFKNAVFPPQIVDGFRRILRDITDRPIIVRSSSLLEDSFGAAFSGKYKSLFVPNTGTEEQRLSTLMDAIAEVYASIFGPDPIEYRRERGLLDFSEEMGILIQEVIGTHIGPYFMPSFSGVAFSRNEFHWSPRIHREDGVIRLVPGLGTRAVDRVGNDYPILIAPNRPNLQVNTLVSEKIKYSPRYMDVINLETGAIETVDVLDIFKKYGLEYPVLPHVVSVNKDGRLTTPNPVLFDPKNSDMVVTFSKLFEKTDFLKKMNRILKLLESKMNTPVDIEFAHDGKNLYFLQCRPQSQALDIERVPIPKNIPNTQKLFSTKKYVTTGQLENIEYIVYVQPEAYGALETREDMHKIARIVGDLNTLLPKRKFILMGPGRWGSRGDIKLGVPVNYGDINNTSLLVEIAKEKGEYIPELSFGTHFFQDLVEADIKYLPLYPDQPDSLFNEDDLLNAPNHLSEFLTNNTHYRKVVHLVKVSDIISGGTLSVIMDGEAGEALGFLKQPDHSTWRLKKTEEIAQALDPTLYGVKALYLVGSTKESTAGPKSDIDLIVHFLGTSDQKEKLLHFFENWDKKLVKENKKRTGIALEGILDVHFVTNEDIRKKSPWAAHITSRYGNARRISLQTTLI